MKRSQHLVKAEEMMKSFDWVIKTPMHGLILFSQAELAVGVTDSDSIDELYQNAIDEFQDNTWGYFYTLFAHILASDSMYDREEYQLAYFHLKELLLLSEKICNFAFCEKALENIKV